MKISTILKRVIPAILFSFIVFDTYVAFNHDTGAGAGYANDPGQSNCATSGCHTDNSGGQTNLFTKSSSVTLSNGNTNTTYIPGATYTMKLTCNRKGHTKFGFEVTALASSTNKMAGTLSVINSNYTQSATGASRTYIEQTLNGCTIGSGGVISWTFKWVAPKPAVGNVIFYTICNATNNNGGDDGDTILAQTFTFTPDTTLPVAKFAYTPTNPCTGDTVQFSDSSTGSPTSWSWTFQNGNPATSTAKNPSVVFSSGGTDSVTLITTNAVGNSKTVKKLITVTPRTGDSIQVKGRDTICSGSAVSLVAPFGLSYKWSTGDTTQTIMVDSTGTYSVNVSNGYCTTNSLPVSITVVKNPVVSLTKSEDTACGGDTVTFTATSGLSSYTFYRNGQKVQLGVSNTCKAANIQQGDSFSATGTNSGGCTSAMSAKVNVALPILPLAPSPACGTTTAAAITFTWPRLANTDGYEVSTDSGKNWVKLPPGSTDTTYTIAGLSYDTYVDLYVRGYNHSKCVYGPVGQALCKTLSCANITYNLKYDSVICAGGLVSLHFSNISISHYSISINGSTPAKDTFFQAAPNANDQIQISITDSSSSCPAQKDLLAITVHKVITMQLACDAADSTYCTGGSTLLTATRGFDTYTWSKSTDGGKNYTQAAQDTSSTYAFGPLSTADTLTWKVTGTNSYGCGGGAATKAIIVQAPPKPYFSYAVNGLAVTFKDSSIGGTTQVWDFGDGDTGVYPTLTHTYTFAAKYKITLKTFSPAGCYDTLSKYVTTVLKSGIEANNYLDNINIYPNPSHSYFSLAFSSALAGTAYIKIVNMNGEEILVKETKLEEGQNMVQLDLSNAPPGFYFMQVITNDGVNTLKLIRD